MTARLTVCIPSHRPAMLAEAIASVHAQTVPVTLLVSFSADWWDTKLNDLIDAAPTEFVAVLCDDDHLAPTFAEETLAAADATGAALVFTDYEDFGDRQHRRTAGPYTLDALRDSNTLLGWTALMHTGTIRRLGNFDPTVRYQDWDMWLRCAEDGVRAHHLASPLVRYRKWAGCGGYTIPYGEHSAIVRERHNVRMATRGRLGA